MNVRLLSECLFVAILLWHSGTDAAGQFTARSSPYCPCDTITFECTVARNISGATFWIFNGGRRSCTLLHEGTSFNSTCGPDNVFKAMYENANDTYFPTSLSGTASSVLDGTLVQCVGPRYPGPEVGNSTIHIIGPPSVPTLSCIGFSEDISGTVNITVSWIMSGGDSADFYLIHITTSDPDPPYGGLLNITASVTQHELTGFRAGYQYNITVHSVNCESQEGNQSEPLIITPKGILPVPTLSCDDVSEDTNGTVTVTVSWTLSGGDSTDFYLINITTNDPQPPYGGLVNITTASVTQRELTGFQAGYEYNVTIHGVNCGSQEGNESEPLIITPQVPDVPRLEVCAIYDQENGTLQAIQNTWNEVNPVNVCEACANGRNITASYVLSYTSSSGTSITTCFVNGTDCSSGVCKHELQNNTTDNRCQPPVPQFNDESMTVTVTARNVVGKSNSSVSRSISVQNAILDVRVHTTNPANASLECMFMPGYNCTIDYGTDPSYTNLFYTDTSSTLGRMATITLSEELQGDTTYYFIVSVKSRSQCVSILGTFQTDSSPICGTKCTIGAALGSVVFFVLGISVTGIVICICICWMKKRKYEVTGG